MEFKLMQALRFKLHPITLCTWSNWYLNMWDAYASTTMKQYYPPESGYDLTFKNANEVTY